MGHDRDGHSSTEGSSAGVKNQPQLSKYRATAVPQAGEGIYSQVVLLSVFIQ